METWLFFFGSSPPTKNILTHPTFLLSPKNKINHHHDLGLLLFSYFGKSSKPKEIKYMPPSQFLSPLPQYLFSPQKNS
jgi:hypothetical protein